MFPDLTRDDVFRIETRRLWLRWPTAKDKDAILKLAGERAVAEMTARIPHPLDRHTVDAFPLKTRGANSAGSGLTLALTERSAPANLIGLVGISDGGGEPHLGYWLGRPWWGNGLMGEAARALVHAYFAYAGGGRLEASALPANPASRRVLEKVGFRVTGRSARPCPARGGDREVDLFGLDRSDWATRAGAFGSTAELAAAS
ncbi:GNAT family N-acetyltransferase [Methylobacterium pseudosasicola]|uniref:Protein N-acetyltransferase, RimJ/RimL family n=1 Tax=Methylobacterium pseudosasicola TaxID=582667 RepID=A0A1I4JJE7_9HYPH|nr:GNAT family N-acetyltransferase [Methylobacterium pseudosasicola]SFL66391.1 Protein N-acetyltransferase, RimJ/RimL family [Methylobacterium pseudosasicola]